MNFVTLGVIILVSSVNSRFYPHERQWVADDLRQHCIEVCDDECEYCNPRNCTENEKYCGTTPSTVHPNCPPDESCVPLDCNCKYLFLQFVFRNKHGNKFIPLI